MLSEYGLMETKAASVSVNDVYGRLQVLAVGQSRKGYRYRYYAICKCSCGSEAKKVRWDSLKDGSISSCGCKHREAITTHGLSGSEHYSRWRLMIDRCYKPDCRAYPNYGGRGIKVCERWHDIANYIDDLPRGHRAELELDRIDNDGDYEPSNVRWATSSQNGSNRRNTRNIEFNGVTKPLSHWAKDLGISISSMADRLDKLGWSVDRALTEKGCDRHENMIKAQKARWAGHTKKPAPPKRKIRTVEWEGKIYTVNQLAELIGANRKLLAKQLFERSWSIEKVMKRYNQT